MSSKNLKSKSLGDKTFILNALFFTASAIILATGYVYVQSKGQLLSISQISQTPTVSVSIGQYTFSLTGYTSPRAKVILEGQGMYEETTAQEDGTFTFRSIFSPFTQREACVTAIDTNGRTSTPMCLPPFPINKHVQMGPIILPPTLSLNQDVYVRNDNAIGSGKSTPQSTVAVHIATSDTESPLTIPTKTDADGNFSLLLPSRKVEAYEISAHTHDDRLTSPASTKLLYDVKPAWYLVLIYPLAFLRDLIPYLIPLILAIEAVLLLVYVKRNKSHKNSDTSLVASERSKT